MRSRIVVVQAEWLPDTEANLNKMERIVTDLYAVWGPAIKLITFSECATCGYDPRQSDSCAEIVPGPTTDRLAALASKTGYYICNGSMMERVGDEVANTTVIVSPQGEIVHHYRKTHPWSPPIGVGRDEGTLVGREFPVTDIPGVGKVGTMICYDGYFPEMARSLVHNGAEIILWNTMGFHPLKDITVATAQVRAAENACYVVLSAGSGIHVGLGLHGNSMVVDPNGVVLSRADESETIFIETVDTAAVRIARTEGVKGMLAPLIDLERFNHRYPFERAAQPTLA